MRLLQLLTASLVPLTSLAAQKSTSDPFQEYHYKQLSHGPLKLDDSSYAELTKAPRNYSIAVVLTAVEARFGCKLCQDFQPEWEALAKSWSKGDTEGESRLIFAILDFTNGKEVFTSLQLQTAPVLVFFHPTTGPHAKAEEGILRYDFSTGSKEADLVHAWLARQLPGRPHPPLVRPINYISIAMTITAVLGGVTFFAIAAPYVFPVIQNRNLWAAVSIILILLFTSGHMFNYIRKAPYVHANSKGGISYFAGGFQNQFGLETQIVAAMYGVLAFATISLALKVPRMSDPRAQQIAVLVWGGVILGMYSFLLSAFRFKNNGYPFWLPPF